MHAFDRRTDGQTDGQTDGRTDRNLIARPRLHCMQRGKKQSNADTQMTATASNKIITNRSE